MNGIRGGDNEWTTDDLRR